MALLLLTVPATKTEAWEYITKKGDTVVTVAALTQSTVSELLQANKLNSEALAEGMILEIPDFISSSAVEIPVVEDHTLPTVSSPLINYTEAELNLLARCIYAEAGGEFYEGQVAVAAVIVNRVQNDRFPDTITEVIYQPKQFECVSNGMINKTATESCYQAALAALYGADNTYGALFFWAPSLVHSRYHESLRYICTIGTHIFASDE